MMVEMLILVFWVVNTVKLYVGTGTNVSEEWTVVIFSPSNSEA